MCRFPIIFLLLIFSRLFSFSQNISIYISEPDAGQLVSKSILNISCSVTSTYEINYVKATVSDRTVNLTNTSSGVFKGELDLEGLSFGSYNLTVKADDYFGNSSEKTISFIYAKPPTLEFENFIDGQCSSGILNLKGKATDCLSLPADCELVVVHCSDSRTIELSGTFDIDIDLSGCPGSEVHLDFRIKDNSFGISNRYTKMVYVENSSSLVKKNEFDGYILDVDSSRVIFAQEYNPYNVWDWNTSKAPSIYNRINNQFKPISIDSSRVIYRNTAKLTSKGAVFFSGKDLYEWDNDTLKLVKRLSDSGDNKKISVKGNYILWSSYGLGKIFLRDLISKETIKIETPSNYVGGLSKDGSVVFRDAENNIYLYRKDSAENIQITTSNNTYDPIIDDSLIIYRKDKKIVLNKLGNELVLSTHKDAYDIDFGEDYQIYKEWVAYTKLGNLGQKHVCIFSPEGEDKTITYFGTSSYIENLNENGEVMLINDNTRYLYTHSGDLKYVSSSLGKSYWADNRWFVAIGNTLFEVDFNATGIPSVESDKYNFSIYPNPSNGIINISVSDLKIDKSNLLSVYSITGEKVFERRTNLNQYQATKIDLSVLNKGIYIVQFNGIAKKIILY